MDADRADRRQATKELLVYFPIAFAITFGLGAGFIFFRPQFEAVVGRIDHPLTSWPYFAAVCAPTISAVLVSAIFGGWSGVRRLFAGLVRPFRPRWALALLAMPVLMVAAGLAERIAGRAPPYAIDLHAILVAAPVLWVTTPEIFLDPGPWGEETGWRGFALPRLLKLTSPLVAAVILGTLWGLWHTPAFFVSGLTQSGQNFALFILAGVCLTIVMTWIYVNANGNYLLAGVLPHAISNHLFTAHAYRGIEVEAAVYLALAVLIVAVFGPTLRGWRVARPAPA